MRLTRLVCCAVSLLLVSAASVAEVTEASAPAAASTPIQYRRVEPVSELSTSGSLGAFVLLVGAAGVAWYVARKRGVRLPLPAFRNQRMQLVETLNLAVRTKLFLVEVDGQRYLVGDGKSGFCVVKCEDGQAHHE